MPYLQNQQAGVIGLVTGAYGPPPRLSWLKSLIRAFWLLETGCCDPDCHQDGCKGNRMEFIKREYPAGAMPPGKWHFNYHNIDVRVHHLHDKNDRRKVLEMYNVEYIMPRNDLTKTLVAHENCGRDVLTMEHPEPSHNVFVSGAGLTFNDQTFAHYWKTCMKTAEEFGIHYFPPSKGRMIFVEEFTRVHM